MYCTYLVWTLKIFRIALVRMIFRGMKVDVKMTFKVTEEDRENFRKDAPIASKLLNRKPDDEINKSIIVRAAIRNLHESLQQGFVPKWLIDYSETDQPTKPKPKSKTKRPKR